MFETRAGALLDARVPAMLAGLSAVGVVTGSDKIRQAHAVAQKMFESASAANQQFQTVDAARVMARELGLPAGRVDVLDNAFSTGSDSADITIVDGVRGAIEAVRASGAATGVVCDVGLTPSPVLEGWLDKHGLLGFFDVLAFSDRLGAYKPSPVMFDHVLSAVGCGDPTRAAHIGDRRARDIAGAKRRGMFAIRFRGVYDDPAEEPEGDAIIDSMHELRTLL